MCHDRTTTQCSRRLQKQTSPSKTNTFQPHNKTKYQSWWNNQTSIHHSRNKWKRIRQLSIMNNSTPFTKSKTKTKTKFKKFKMFHENLRITMFQHTSYQQQIQTNKPTRQCIWCSEYQLSRNINEIKWKAYCCASMPESNNVDKWLDTSTTCAKCVRNKCNSLIRESNPTRCE